MNMMHTITDQFCGIRGAEIYYPNIYSIASPTKIKCMFCPKYYLLFARKWDLKNSGGGGGGVWGLQPPYSPLHRCTQVKALRNIYLDPKLSRNYNADITVVWLNLSHYTYFLYISHDIILFFWSYYTIVMIYHLCDFLHKSTWGQAWSFSGLWKELLIRLVLAIQIIAIRKN